MTPPDLASRPPSNPLTAVLVGCAAMVLAAAAAFLLVAYAGGTLAAPGAATLPAGMPPAPEGPSLLARVLFALAAVIVTGQLLSRLLAYVGQPPVIGEVAAGILLGPSLIGADLSAFVLPPSIAPILGVVAQLGVILYMFVVGIELHPGQIRRHIHLTLTTSVASIAVPFVLGAALALVLYPHLSPANVPFTSFALFMGVAMSITAFPVLARILTDLGMAQTELGAIAIACAAINDGVAWCLLALIVGVAHAEVGRGLQVAMAAGAYVAFMLFVARPQLARLLRRWRTASTSGPAAVLFVALLVSSLLTEAIGIHAIFGAFLLGAIVPHDSEAARGLSRQLKDVVTVLLLPAFFAFTGMRTRIDLLSSGSLWLFCGLIIVVATVGKFAGTFAASKACGLDTRQAAVLGTLMNTRGLMELIVLNVGLELGVISPTLFAMMVIMALVTTMTTAPIVGRMRIPANP